MDTELVQRGFTPKQLSPIQQRELDEQGFTLLENIIDPQWLGQLRQAFEELIEQEGEGAGIEVAQMDGVRRLADLEADRDGVEAGDGTPGLRLGMPIDGTMVRSRAYGTMSTSCLPPR